MKYIKPLVIAAFLLICVSSCKKDDPVVPGQRNSIVILYENDVHCAIEGYAKMAGLRDAIADTAHVGMVSAGDYLQGGTVGAISNGGYIIDIMRRMHYDAVSLGNHEFDYGMPQQLALLGSFNAPVLCTNLYDMQGNRVYAPYTICSYGDRRIAFVGVVTARSEENTPYAFVANGHQAYTLNRDQVVEMVQESVNEARAQGVDYVIVLSHLGEIHLEGFPSSHEMVEATTGIDIVLDAHTHSVVLCDTVMNANGRPVYITQTGTQFANVGQLVITREGEFRFELIPVESIPYINDAVAYTTDSVQTLVDDITGQTVFHSDYDLTVFDADGYYEVRRAETNAGDLVADAIRYVMDADLGLNNGGGFRTDIVAGDVTYNQIIDMLPFDNRLVKIEATGAILLEMLNRCMQDLPNMSGSFPQVSGIRFTVEVVEGGENVVSSVEVQQPDGSYAPINPTATYTVGTTDYCAYKGGFHNTLIECPVLQGSPTLYREVLGAYVNEVCDGIIPRQYAQPQGRITIIQ